MSSENTSRRVTVARAAVLTVVAPPVGVAYVAGLLGRKAYRKYQSRVAKHHVAPASAPAPTQSSPPTLPPYHSDLPSQSQRPLGYAWPPTYLVGPSSPSEVNLPPPTYSEENMRLSDPPAEITRSNMESELRHWELVRGRRQRGRVVVSDEMDG